MADQARSISAETLSVVECMRSFGETPESDKGPRPTEVCVGKIGVLREQRVVLQQNRPGIVTKQSQGRKSDAIVGSTSIRGEPGAVGAFGAVEITEASTHEPERMPGARIPRIAPNGLAESRFRQLWFSPGRCAQPSGSWAGRITRSQLCGRIVLRERGFVVMSELERVTHLECGLRALSSELSRKCLRMAFSSTQITDRARKSNRKPSLDERVRLAREVPLDQRERFFRLPCVGEQHGFPGALAGLDRASREAEQQRE